MRAWTMLRRRSDLPNSVRVRGGVRGGVRRSVCANNITLARPSASSRNPRRLERERTAPFPTDCGSAWTPPTVRRVQRPARNAFAPYSRRVQDRVRE